MIQYDDFKFSEIGDVEEMMKRFQEELEAGFPLKAFHVGTATELSEVQKKLTEKEKMEALEKEINEIAKEVELLKKKDGDGIIDVPSKEEINMLFPYTDLTKGD